MIENNRKTLLLVEDEALLAVTQKMHLEKYGYSVLIANSGEEAIALCDENSAIDLILMDINLDQSMDGTEAADCILKRHNVPIIFLSSHTEYEVVNKTEKITPYGYIIKNSGIAVLVVSIKMAFKLFEANRKLIAEKERQTTILNSLGDGVIATDENGIISQMNPVAESLTGWKSADAVGTSLAQIFPNFASDSSQTGIEQNARYMAKLIDSRKANQILPMTLNGKKLKLSISGAPILDCEGNTNGIVLVFRDVSDEYDTQESLRQRESYLTAIIENQPGLVWLKDKDSRFLAVNSAFLRSCGLSDHGEIAGKTDLDIWPEDLAEKYRTDDRAVIESAQPKTTEETIADNGVLTWFETFKTPVFSEQKKVIGTTGYSRDITRRKTTESDRNRSENRYRNLVELAADGIMLVSSDGIITEANEYMCGLLGMERAKIIGTSEESLPFTPESLEQCPLSFQQLQRGEIESCVRKLRHSSGKEMTVDTRSKTMPDRSYQSIYRDITEKTKIEEALRLKSVFLEAVANSSADGILVVDLRGQIILQNKRTIELWEIPAEIIANPDGTRQVSHVMYMTKNPERFVAEIEHQKRFPLDVTVDQLELINGTVLHRHSAPVLGTDGQNYGRIYHFHDITSFRQAEEKIRGLLKEKEIILREVHHRVKNYMNTISGLLTLQMSTLTDPLAIHALEDTQDRIRSMLTLYDKLYVSAGFEAISAANYLPNLIDEIIANFPKHTVISIEKKIADHVLKPQTLQVLSIITNELLTNIIKSAFTDRTEGKITISLVIVGVHVKFSIQDNGIGISEKLATDISGTSEMSGGFGLLLVHLLVKQLDGTLTIARQNGTKVTIEFTLADDELSGST